MIQEFFRGLVDAREMELRSERIRSRVPSKKEQKDR